MLQQQIIPQQNQHSMPSQQGMQIRNSHQNDPGNPYGSVPTPRQSSDNISNHNPGGMDQGFTGSGYGQGYMGGSAPVPVNNQYINQPQAHYLSSPPGGYASNNMNPIFPSVPGPMPQVPTYNQQPISLRQTIPLTVPQPQPMNLVSMPAQIPDSQPQQIYEQQRRTIGTGQFVSAPSLAEDHVRASQMSYPTQGQRSNGAAGGSPVGFPESNMSVKIRTDYARSVKGLAGPGNPGTDQYNVPPTQRVYMVSPKSGQTADRPQVAQPNQPPPNYDLYVTSRPDLSVFNPKPPVAPSQPLTGSNPLMRSIAFETSPNTSTVIQHQEAKTEAIFNSNLYTTNDPDPVQIPVAVANNSRGGSIQGLKPEGHGRRESESLNESANAIDMGSGRNSIDPQKAVKVGTHPTRPQVQSFTERPFDIPKAKTPPKMSSETSVKVTKAKVSSPNTNGIGSKANPLKDETQYRSLVELAAHSKTPSKTDIGHKAAGREFGSFTGLGDTTKSQKLPGELVPKSPGSTISASKTKEHPFKEGPLSSRLGKFSQKLTVLPKKPSKKGSISGKGSTGSIKPLISGDAQTKISKKINNILKGIGGRASGEHKKPPTYTTVTTTQASTTPASTTAHSTLRKSIDKKPQHSSITGLLSQIRKNSGVRTTTGSSNNAGNVSSGNVTTRSNAYSSFVGVGDQKSSPVEVEKQEVSIYHSNEKLLSTPRDSSNPNVYDLLYTQEHASKQHKVLASTDMKKTVGVLGMKEPQTIGSTTILAADSRQSTLDEKRGIYINKMPFNLQLCTTTAPQTVLNALSEVISRKWTQKEAKIIAGKHYSIKVTIGVSVFTARVEALDPEVELYTVCFYPETISNMSLYQRQCREIFAQMRL